MSPKAWHPTPMLVRRVDGAPSIVLSVVLSWFRCTWSDFVIVKLTGWSPSYAPLSSHWPPRPSSKPRSLSSPFVIWTSHPFMTVSVRSPFTLFVDTAILSDLTLAAPPPPEEVDEIFYTIKPWGYCGGVGVSWSTWLIVRGGPPLERFAQLDIIPPNRIGDYAEAYQQITVAVLNGHQEGHRLLRLDIRKSLEHTVISMDPNLYAFNRDASYATCAGFPHNDAYKDLIGAHVQFVVPEKSHGGRGDFTAEVEDIFAKYRLPHISSETVIGLWQTDPMGFWQNQAGPPHYWWWPAPWQWPAGWEFLRGCHDPDHEKGQDRRRFERRPLCPHGCSVEHRRWPLCLSALLSYARCQPAPIRRSSVDRPAVGRLYPGPFWGPLPGSLPPHRHPVPHNPA